MCGPCHVGLGAGAGFRLPMPGTLVGGGGCLLGKEALQTSPLGRKPEASAQMGRCPGKDATLRRYGPYLKVRWGLFHFLPVRA